MLKNGTIWHIRHIILTSLLKVVDTCFWAQNDRNVQVYISTYNNFKLYGASFSHKSQKTVAMRQNTNFASEGRRELILRLK